MSWRTNQGNGRGTYIAAAYSCPVDPDYYIVRGFDVRDGAVFELYFVLRFEDEGEILSL